METPKDSSTVKVVRVSKAGSMKITAYTIFGILFFLAGLVALIHPNFVLPGQKTHVTIANQDVLMETSRVVSIPRAASAAEVVLGLGLVFFGSRKLR
jgi:hypothetical protein